LLSFRVAGLALQALARLVEHLLAPMERGFLFFQPVANFV